MRYELTDYERGGHQADVVEQGARRASCGRSTCGHDRSIGEAAAAAM